MDPVSQTLAQQQSGSADGAGFGQFFVAGQQAGLARRRLDLERSQLTLDQQREGRLAQAQSLLLPYEQEAKRLANEQAGIELDVATLKKQAMVQSNAILPQIIALEMEAMQLEDGAATPEWLQRVLDLSQKNAFAFGPGMPGERLRQMAKGALVMKNDFLQMLEMDKKLQERGLRLQGAQRNPETGSSSFQFGQERAADTGMQSTVGKLVNDYRSLLNSGDTEGAQFAKAALIKAGQADGLSITFDERGMPVIKQGAAAGDAGGLTTTTQTELQRTMDDADTALQALDRAVEAVKAFPEGVGALGKLRSGVEIGRGMLNPRAEIDMPSTAVQQELTKAFQQIAKGLRVDTGNMSKYELEQLERLGNEATWTTSAQKTLQTYAGLRAMTVAKKVRAQKKLTGQVDNRILGQLPTAEITRMYSNGLLDTSESIRALQVQLQSGVITPAEMQAIILKLQEEARKTEGVKQP